VLFNWHHQNREDWAERPGLWLTGSECDAWLLCSETSDAITYASDWLRSAPKGDLEHYQRLLDQWLAYYERLGIGMISFGAMIFRRRSGRRNWFRAESSPPGRPAGSCSAQIERVFAAQDFLQEVADDRQLFDRSFRLIAEHEIEHSLRVEGGRLTARQALLRQTEGFGFVGKVDRLVVDLLAGCDGQRPLRQVSAELAPRENLTPEQVSSAAVGVIRRLLETGFLAVGRPTA